MSHSHFDPLQWTRARRSWALCQQDNWLSFQQALPAGPQAPFDFSNAQSLLSLCARRPEFLSYLGIGPTAQAARLLRYQRRGIRVLTQGEEHERWVWAPDTDSLRAEFWKPGLSVSQALSLAREATLSEPAPWLLWACASPSAPALVEALQNQGYRQAAMPPWGLAGAPFALGFSELPFSSWARSCCSLLDSSSACDAFGDSYEGAMQEAIQAISSLRAHGSMDWIAAFDQSTRASFGLMDHFWVAIGSREEPADLAAAAVSDYAAATLSPRLAGIDATARAQWPLARAIDSAPYDSLPPAAERLLALGADPNAILLNSNPAWWNAAEPIAEQGAEGYVALMRPEHYQAYFDAGADFSLPVGRPRIDQPQALDAFYQSILRPGEVEAQQLSALWVGRSRARSQAEQIAASVKHAPRAPASRL